MSLRCRRRCHGGAEPAGAAGAACAGAGGGAGPGEGRAAGAAGPHREHEPGGDGLQPLQVRPGGGGRGALKFPTWLGWQGCTSGLLCIILLYSTEREETVSFLATSLINGAGVGIT